MTVKNGYLMLMYLSMNVIVPLILRNEVGNNPSAQGIVNNILLLIAIIIFTKLRDVFYHGNGVIRSVS